MIDLPHELNSDGYTGQAGAQKREIELNRIGIDYAADIASRCQLPAQVFEQAGRVTGASTRAGNSTWLSTVLSSISWVNRRVGWMHPKCRPSQARIFIIEDSTPQVRHSFSRPPMCGH